MFDKYLIVAGSAHDVVEDGAIVGFAFSVRIGYYRGLGIVQRGADVHLMPVAF